jgi:hypothetical protein
MSARLRHSFLLRLAAAALLSTLPACAGDGIVVPGDGAIARLEAVAGDGQRAVAGQPVARPLVVRAVDQSNRPVTGAEITFRFINTDGRVAPGTMATGTDGRATAEVTLGGSVGAQVVEARVVGPEALAVEFQLTALQRETPDPPAPPPGGNGGDDGNGGGGNGGGGNDHGNGNGGTGGTGHGDGGSVGGGGAGGGAPGGGGGGSAGGDDGNGGNGGAAGGGDGGGGGGQGDGGNGNNGKGKGHDDHGHDDHGHGHRGGGGD